jgi:hypothetical protein
MHHRASAGPHRELFIYYLKGRLKTGSKTLPDDCIGNWEEEEDSFLFFARPASKQVENLLSRQPQLSYIDSYQMPYEQWLGEVFSTFEHGKFRVIPSWEASNYRNDDDGFLSKKRFIVSGLLRSEARDIAGTLARRPVKIIKQWTHDGIWHTFYGKIE